MKNRRGVVFIIIVNAKGRTVCKTAERELWHSHSVSCSFTVLSAFFIPERGLNRHICR